MRYKKFLAICSAISICLSITGCNSNSSDNSTNSVSGSTTESGFSEKTKQTAEYVTKIFGQRRFSEKV